MNEEHPNGIGVNSALLHFPSPWIHTGQNARSPIEVHNRLVDSKSSVVVDIVAPRSLTKQEMETYVARALQKLRNEDWPKAGGTLTLMAMDEDGFEAEFLEYASRWQR